MSCIYSQFHGINPTFVGFVNMPRYIDDCHSEEAWNWYVFILQQRTLNKPGKLQRFIDKFGIAEIKNLNKIVE